MFLNLKKKKQFVYAENYGTVVDGLIIEQMFRLYNKENWKLCLQNVL
jgi:hypothetical protein